MLKPTHILKYVNDKIQKVCKMELTLEWIASLLKLIHSIQQGLKTLEAILSSIPYLSVIVMVLLCALTLLVSAFNEKEWLVARIAKGIFAVVLGAGAITTLIFSAPFIGLVLTGISAAQHLWELGVAVVKRFTSNEIDKTSLDATIAEKSHGMVLSILAFIPAVLAFLAITTFAPPLAIAGAAVALGLTTYVLVDKLGYNPLRYLANKIFNHPFKTVEPEKIEEKAEPVDTPQPLSSTQQVHNGLGGSLGVTVKATTSQIHAKAKEAVKPVSENKKAGTIIPVMFQRLGNKLSQRLNANPAERMLTKQV